MSGLRGHRSRAAEFETAGQAGDPRVRVRRRPNPWEWLRYSLGAGLSPQLSQWVLRDTTGPTWWLRHLLRSLLWMAPLLIGIIVFLPGPLDLRIYTAVLGLLTGLMWATFTMWGVTEHRAVKAGFAPGEVELVRQERVQAVRDRRRAS